MDRKGKKCFYKNEYLKIDKEYTDIEKKIMDHIFNKK